jgi:hypothetical protein
MMTIFCPMRVALAIEADIARKMTHCGVWCYHHGCRSS